MIRRIPTRETPFALTYIVEALIPVEIFEESPRVHFYQDKSNSEALVYEKDLLEKTQETTTIRNAHYKQIVTQYHN